MMHGGATASRSGLMSLKQDLFSEGIGNHGYPPISVFMTYACLNPERLRPRKPEIVVLKGFATGITGLVMDAEYSNVLLKKSCLRENRISLFVYRGQIHRGQESGMEIPKVH